MQLFRRCYSSLPDAAKVLQRFEFRRATNVVADLKEGSSAVLNGWVDKKPKKMGKGLVFARLRDTQGRIIQLVDRNEPSLIKSLQPESAISVAGSVEPRHDANGNRLLDLSVENIEILNSAKIIGSQLTTGDTKEWPAEHRYLQLRTDASLRRNLQTRAKVVSACRSALDSLGFTEIETPLLFKSTPEGAREFLVPTRRKGQMYALPQSPQQYKQLLMASGVHRYYQIAKCFRDEDLRQDRQFEFTQLDMEMSFADGRDVRSVVEQVVKSVSNVAGIDLLSPDGSPVGNDTEFSQLTYQEVLGKYGIDKPDLRSTLSIKSIPSELARSLNAEFPVVEAIILDEDHPSLHDPNEYKRMPVIVNSNDWSSSALTTIADVPDLDALKTFLQVSPGQVVAFATRQQLSYENPTPLGRFRQLAIAAFPDSHRLKKLDGSIINPSDFVASWVVDFPLFNPVELGEENGYPRYDRSSYVSTHHPFTMANLADYENLSRDPLQVRGQHYDLVVNGVEVGGGSTRIHDVELQRYVFEQVLKIPQSDRLFGHLLRAFDTGCPPHAGLAIGLDRLVAMVCGTASIRDVIAFPKSITGADVMIGAPSKVTKEQLAPYHIRSV